MSDFVSVAADLAASIRLGYEAEQDDPGFHFEVPSEEEITWLGAWLASEGWVRPSNWLKR